MFSVKDPILRGLRAGVVNKFLCAGCSACYAGETTRNSSTRVRAHIFSDRTSHILKLLQNSEDCRTLCSNDCFSILDHASTTFELKIKEAIHIQWKKPTLNHQHVFKKRCVVCIGTYDADRKKDGRCLGPPRRRLLN